MVDTEFNELLGDPGGVVDLSRSLREAADALRNTDRALFVALELVSGQAGASIDSARNSIRTNVDLIASAVQTLENNANCLEAYQVALGEAQDQAKIAIRRREAAMEARVRLEFSMAVESNALAGPSIGSMAQFSEAQADVRAAEELWRNAKASKEAAARSAALGLRGVQGIAPNGIVVLNGGGVSFAGIGHVSGLSVPFLAGSGGGDGKPSLDEILEKYQVTDSDLVEWNHWLFGKHSLTKKEAEMIDKLDFFSQAEFFSIGQDAFDRADMNFPPDRGSVTFRNDNQNDAFRHAYWTAKLAYSFGADWAEDYSTAHEMREDNVRTREAMDLYNNEVGLSVQKAHPNLWDAPVLEYRIYAAVAKGDMVVVSADGKSLNWSDTAETAGTPEEVRGGGNEPQFHDKDARS